MLWWLWEGYKGLRLKRRRNLAICAPDLTLERSLFQRLDGPRARVLHPILVLKV